MKRSIATALAAVLVVIVSPVLTAGAATAGSTAQVTRTPVVSVDLERRAITLLDGRVVRYDGNDDLTLALAYVHPDNVRFSTRVRQLTPTAGWYAVLEGTYQTRSRGVSVLRYTVVSEPSVQARAVCADATGDAYGGACAAPAGTGPVVYTGVPAEASGAPTTG